MRTLRADQLKIGDVLLKDDGSYDSTVEDVFTDVFVDGSQTWLDTGDTMGYLPSRTKFNVEWDD